MDSITPEMIRLLREKLDSLVAITESEDSTLPPIQLTFDPIGTIAGYAYTFQYRISLNSVLLLHDFEQMKDVILGHEVAHIMTHHYYGPDVANHGKEWKGFMDMYGLPPDVTHFIDTTLVERKVTHIKYSCKCEGRIHRMSTKSHRCIQVLNERYVCPYCKDTIVCMEDIQPNAIIPSSLLHDTKVNKAKWIMLNKTGPRPEMIKLLIEGAGLSAKGANTYYHNLKNLVV